MSFQRFQRATSTNILFTGVNQAIGPDAISNTSNYNKFLKNNGGNASWVSLPLPDVTTVPSTQDQFAVVFDFASQSFILRKIPIPYNALIDSKVIWCYIPATSNTTFVSNALTQVSNLSLNATTYDIKSSTVINPYYNPSSISAIYHGSNFILGSGNQGLNMANSRGTCGLINTLGIAKTPNCSYTFAFQAYIDATFPSNQSANFQVLRTCGPNGPDFSNIILSFNAQQQGPNPTSVIPSVQFMNAGTQYNITPSAQTYSNGGYYIFSVVCENGITYLYWNGKLMGSVSKQLYYNASSFACQLLNGSVGVPPFDQTQMFYGTCYAIVMCENSSVAQCQLIEGYIKWSSSVKNIPFTLDSSHPWNTQAPST